MGYRGPEFFVLVSGMEHIPGVPVRFAWLLTMPADLYGTVEDE